MEFKKLVCHIDASAPKDLDGRLATDWFEVNKRTHEMLDVVKIAIGNDRRWDRFKRYFNMFELVSSSACDIPGFAAYTPTSRSFFKLTELLADHGVLTRPHASRSAFLCDAPGGFIEAYIMHRKRKTLTRTPYDWHGRDVMHAISLVVATAGGTATCSATPGWRLPRDLMRNHNVHLHGGDENGDGDLYNLVNIDTFVRIVVANSCDLVTADGGFDFSGDFNSQERSSLRLLVSEVYTAMLLQADDGCFLVKMYDLRLPETLRLLWLLHCCYPGGIVIDKPGSSRAANSEKFIVCKRFKRTASVDALMLLLRESVARGRGEVPLVDGVEALPPAWFLREVVLFNTRYISAQTKTIMGTLSYMRAMDHPVGAGAHVPYPCFAEQAVAAKEWCAKYGFPMSMTSPDHAGSQSSWDKKTAWAPSVTTSHPRSVPGTTLTPAPVPKIDSEGVGTSATHIPLSLRSRSPSTTPYKDGLLLPGRKLVAENCTRPPGGGPAETRLALMR